MANELTVGAAMPLGDIERLAHAVAKSRLFGITTPEQALTLMSIAQAEGRHPALAARDYHIINGSPAKKAEAMLRDFLQSGGKVEWHELTDEAVDATFSHPQGGTVRIKWDHNRAKQAGIRSPMWQKYPRQMLRSRVVSEGVRTVCPMATSGMYVPEEVAEYRSAPPPAQPEQQSARSDLDTFAADGETGEIVERDIDKEAREAARRGMLALETWWKTELSRAEQAEWKPNLDQFWKPIAEETDAAMDRPGSLLDLEDQMTR